MLSIDPEREAAGRTIATMLVAKEIRQGGPIHLETILTEIGALAGFAAQMSVRKAIIEPQKLDLNEVLPEVVTTNGADVSAAESAPVSASASATSEQGAVQATGAAEAGEAGAKPAPADAPAKDAAPAVVETADPEAARQQTVQAYQDAAARAAAQANKDRGERGVLAQFKDAAREAKRLIEDAVRKLKAKNPSDPDAREAEQATAAMEKEIKELSDTIQAQRDGSTADVFVGALAGIATANVAAPAVDILT